MREDFMEAVTRYRCRYCDKLFISNRHNCKFDPGLSGCFTCQHLVSIKENIVENEEYGEIKEKVIICDIEKPVSMVTLADMKWALRCESWEELENYQGKDSFLNHLRQCRLKSSNEKGEIE